MLGRSGSLSPQGRAVVITGASSGLGEAAALHLDRLGFQVFAGVRRPADGERLATASTGRLHPVRIDVTDEESIRVAAKTVVEELGGTPLWGLVNNAGIVVPAPLAWLDLGRFREQLETNLVGQLAVIQGFLPLLRGRGGSIPGGSVRGAGRIVNVTSGLGSIAVPFLGAYVASQFAKEGFSDVLRRELAPLGVSVSVVRTGAIVTPMWYKAATDGNRLADEAPEATAADYRNAFLRFLETNEKQARSSRTTPADFARTIAHALTAARPKIRYAVGRDAAAAAVASRLVPAALLDRQFRGVVSGAPAAGNNTEEGQHA